MCWHLAPPPPQHAGNAETSPRSTLPLLLVHVFRGKPPALLSVVTFILPSARTCSGSFAGGKRLLGRRREPEGAAYTQRCSPSQSVTFLPSHLFPQQPSTLPVLTPAPPTVCMRLHPCAHLQAFLFDPQEKSRNVFSFGSFEPVQLRPGL